VTTIHLNENMRVVKTDDYNYQVEYFRKGGKLVRNPANGQYIEQEDKWLLDDNYYPSVRSAVKRATQLEVEKKDEYKSLMEYVEAHEKIMEEMLRKIK